MTAKEIEKAAYAAAHRILEVNTIATEFACPGAQRSHAVDAIAEIIREVFEPSSLDSDEPAQFGLRVVNHRRSATLLELPVRFSS